MELLHRRCCGLDVHKETVVACLRLVSDGKVRTEVRTFQTTTADHLRLSEWLATNGCTHVAMEATDGHPLVVDAGPGTDFHALHRARAFQSDDKFEAALCRPDQQLGPPPALNL